MQKKTFDRVQHPCMIKALKVSIKKMYLNTMKSISDKHTANIIMMTS